MIGHSRVVTDGRIRDICLFDRDDGRNAHSENEKYVSEVSQLCPNWTENGRPRAPRHGRFRHAHRIGLPEVTSR